METYEIEINGTIVKITTDKKLNISDVIVSLSKHLNGDDVKVEDCIYKGKKKYFKEIKINYL
jgi:tmRNA-binding protein